jgi:hypothetical protein
MPTGWRPEDVESAHPISKITDPYTYKKYDTPTNTLLNVWIWIQFGILFLLIAYLFGNIAAIGAPAMFFYGLYIFMQVYAYTELMDLNPKAWIAEAIKNAWGIYLLWYSSDWFGLGKMVFWAPEFLGIYFLLATPIVLLLLKTVKRN